MVSLRSTNDFVQLLQKEGELQVFSEPVDPYLELAEIQRQVVAKKGPALLFTNVKGTKFPVATNLYGSEKRIHLAFGPKPVATIQRLAKLAKEIFPPRFSKLWKERSLGLLPFQVGLKQVRKAPVLSGGLITTSELPQVVSWPKDGGAFVTLPLVYTQHPESGNGNLGMYRVQLFPDKTVGMHIQIHRGGGFHYYEAEKKGESLPAHVYIGGPPALTIAAVAPLPEEIPELVFASFLMGEKLRMKKDKLVSPYPIVADADFAIIGSIPPNLRKPEGPFGDHYGYYSLLHDYPYLELSHVLHRKDAIWAATVVGRPPQEDHYIAEFLQDLLSPMFPLVMPQVLGVWAYEESGVHSLAAAIVKERYFREAFMGALRILGEGQLSLTKCLLVTNERVNLKNFSETFKVITERCDPRTDFFIFSHISQDTLDYTSGTVNKGSKLLWMGITEANAPIKFPNLPKEFTGTFKDKRFQNPKVFLPGVLVVKGSAYTQNDRLAENLLSEDLGRFHYIFLVDDSEDAIKTDSDFIWTMFTRMEPASDVYARTETKQNHIAYQVPIVFDCRMKPWIPEVLVPLPETVKQVNEKFGKIIDAIG
ncbi:UbiD family decarboxylase [Leptospira congkakensis]|uniref:UbiD family decarboxylase n=1 Tax=Leptospira congkakensis TaxID=2484932 RepID=A0A4Z1A5I6_9LEPT|nr:UbiD family decarboxylase [Leptospira congkakensis]TGL90260.1 UbiD family decarboxylase [Leptospira congkakensis]TGL91267.1 UbiD family decarboxylase [Leptospira congkakensis]TGL98319.1 UbiD family decarboxylase [Leptospira congkakensis]